VTSLKIKRREALSNEQGESGGKGERNETLSNQIFMKPYVCRVYTGGVFYNKMKTLKNREKYKIIINNM